jgi:cellulose synthase/poly-beta-1,6-N-acetylglucosamine synthase-like glycosyltransferase
MIIEILFWLSVLLLLHTYMIYPVILSLLSGRGKKDRITYSREDDLPVVSVIISAFNEEEVIAEKIVSIYNTIYPTGKLEVLAGSDASDDRTAEILNDLAKSHPSLKVFDFKERRGKGNVVNDLVEKATGSILVLTDANVMFDRDTLFQTVKHFKDERIGLVDTNMVNRGMTDEGISYQEKAYISREVKIKNNEGRLWGAMMGPFGGCYAIRKEDYPGVPPNFLVDDFYINMKIFEKGKLAVNEINARVYEDLPDKLSVEFRRKVRIGTGNWQNLRTFRKLLFSSRYGFAFWSHKVIRWIGPFLMIIALVTNLFLVFRNDLYFIPLAFQVLLMLIPFLDAILKRIRIHVRPFRLVTHFYFMNIALLVGCFRSMGTVSSGVWERTSRD